MASTESYKARDLIRRSEATLDGEAVTAPPGKSRLTVDQQIAIAQVEATLALAYAVLAVEKALPD